MSKIEVVALRKGLKGGQIREAGDIFEVDAGDTSKWYRPTKEAKKETKSADTNQDGALSKAEILAWFEENKIEVNASLGVAKLREAYAEAQANLQANPSTPQTQADETNQPE